MDQETTIRRLKYLTECKVKITPRKQSAIIFALQIPTVWEEALHVHPSGSDEMLLAKQAPTTFTHMLERNKTLKDLQKAGFKVVKRDIPGHESNEEKYTFVEKPIRNFEDAVTFLTPFSHSRGRAGLSVANKFSLKSGL